ncbi:MAG: hypothetical protein WCN88_01210 [Candidatus Falkowbacteria bacterium]
MKFKKLGKLSLTAIYYFVNLVIILIGILFFWPISPFISQPYEIYSTISFLALILIPIYAIFYKNKIMSKSVRVILLLILFTLLCSAEFYILSFFEILPIILVLLALIYFNRISLKKWLSSEKNNLSMVFRKKSNILNKNINKLLTKILPLIILYLLFIISFLGNSDYELLIVLLAAIPLIIYIFTENGNLKKYLQYLLYLFIIGIIFYWVKDSYGYVWSIFNGYFSFSWPSCYFAGCYGETGRNVFIQSGVFYGDLKVIFYLGVIYLAIKNKNRIKD